MLYPNATYKPVQNHGGAMRVIKGLVLHVQEGNGSLFGWFNNPTSQVSAHFWVSKLGVMEQYVDTEQIAWAEAAGNPNYLSIETEGFVNEPLTESQMGAIAQLLIWMNERFNTPLVGPVEHGAYGFTQHCNPDGTVDPAWGGHSCPGPIRLAQMTQILALTETPPQPITIPEGEVTSMEQLTIDGVEYLVSNVVAKGHLVQVRQTLASVGQASTGQNTSIIDLTNQWPNELGGVTSA